MEKTEKEKVEDLCLAALELEEGQWAEFLEEACGDDAALRREVESLLAQEEKIRSFLEAPALEVAAKALAQDQVESLVGREVGSYRVISLLGEGGMGRVYLAQDTGLLDRKVALKFLPEEFVRDRQQMQRFRREARALASLNHPHISIIHDFEEAGDVPALVLELVEGQTLAERVAKVPFQ